MFSKTNGLNLKMTKLEENIIMKNICTYLNITIAILTKFIKFATYNIIS